MLPLHDGPQGGNSPARIGGTRRPCGGTGSFLFVIPFRQCRSPQGRGKVVASIGELVFSQVLDD